MFKEIKYIIFVFIIGLFIFFTAKYYFSDAYKKKSYRSLNNIENKINTYSEKLPILEDDTKNIIEYVCLLYTSPSPRDVSTSRMPSSA